MSVIHITHTTERKSRHSGLVVVCLRCRDHKRHEARGLCKCCYNHLRENRCRTGEQLSDYLPLGGYGTAASYIEDGDAAAMRRNLDPAWIPKRGES